MNMNRTVVVLKDGCNYDAIPDVDYSVKSIQEFYEKTGLSVGYEAYTLVCRNVVDMYGSYSEIYKPVLLPLTGDYMYGKDPDEGEHDILISEEVEQIIKTDLGFELVRFDNDDLLLNYNLSEEDIQFAKKILEGQ